MLNVNKAILTSKILGPGQVDSVVMPVLDSPLCCPIVACLQSVSLRWPMLCHQLKYRLQISALAFQVTKDNPNTCNIYKYFQTLTYNTLLTKPYHNGTVVTIN